MLCVVVAALAATTPSRAADDGVPAFETLRAAHRPSDLIVLDRHGEPIQTLRIDDKARRLPWQPLATFSPALRELIVHGEDRQFWSHGGVDWSGLARGALARTQGRVQGGSTLTMQLAALLDPALARPAGGRGALQKWSQIGAAHALEARWSKAQILEAYLNLVPLRGELIGVPAASHHLFGKQASGLDRGEAALLVALLRAPNAAPALVQRRACALLGEAPDCERIGSLASRALVRRSAPPLGEQLAPHHARWLLAQQAKPITSVRLRSTLDARLQRSALQALRTQMAELQGRQVEDGAVLVLDNRSGEVLAWVGSSGPAWSDAPAVDAVLARRQPGSTLKPFVYALAFERGTLTPASLLHDAPADLDGGSGAFMPRNYDHRYRGWVSARSALAASLNVPAARLAALVGPEPLFERLNAAGLQLSESGGYHGLALALGSADVTLLQLSNAYRMLANGGRWTPVAGTPGAARAVFDARVAFQVGDILADAGARATTFGLDSALVTRGFAAVKTGTSKDMRDNWCIGFTDRYTVGVWVGNASGDAMHHVSGTQGAAPVWRALVQQLHAQQPSRAPPPPPGLERRAIHFDNQLEAPRDEWFLQGSGETLADARGRVPISEHARGRVHPNEHARGRLRVGEQLAQKRPSGISSPRDGSVFALDPDMPAPVQRIRFEGEAGQWWLDGQPLGSGASLQWMPWPGRHRLELKAADGRVIDRIAFEVRGAYVRR
ncbi:penicillin-binding protein 1C [Aquincola sp. S2]|uniref:peptidoglycan glycosyltransferase n=1 Tax=Pseudaquabacterium terrae TaxID=2732868 RepID=A0ABX2EKW3_9BURK|nr:penicillin-binding protein 1C [Aquabacterium terrae]